MAIQPQDTQAATPLARPFGPADGGLYAWFCPDCGACNTVINNPIDCSVCSKKRDRNCRWKVVGIRRPAGLASTHDDEPDWLADERAAANETRNIGLNINENGLLDNFAPPFVDGDRGQEYAKMMSAPPGWEHELESDPNYRPTGMIFTPEEVLDTLQHMNERDLDQALRGEMISSERQKLFGFKPEDLIRYGCIFDESVKSNNLTNEVHALFSKDHWPGLPQVVYDFLLPSLRLATNFLLHPLLAKFWVTLAFGERVVDTEVSARFGFDKKRVIDVEPTEENLNQLHKFFDYLGKETQCISYHFSTEQNALSTTRECFGLTNFVSRYELPGNSQYPKDWQNVPGEPDRPRLWHAPITLNYDFYASIAKRIQHGFPDQNQRLRFYLFFTVNVVHEFAHAFAFVDINRPGRGDRIDFAAEPLFRDWDQVECGWAWEQYVLGGMLNCINVDVDCQYGLSHNPFPERRYGPPGAAWKLYRMIPMSYVSWIQQQKTWQESMYPEFPSQVNLPNSSFPVSLGYDITTTLSEEEYQRSRMEAMGVDDEFMKSLGLFGPPETKNTKATITALRNSLREVDPDDTCLRLFVARQEGKILERPDMSRERYPHTSDEEYTRAVAIEAKLHEHNKLKFAVARKIFNYSLAEQQGKKEEADEERRWEKEEADIARQLDNEASPEELRAMHTESKALHYISLEDWSKHDAALRKMLQEQESFDNASAEEFLNTLTTVDD